MDIRWKQVAVVSAVLVAKAVLAMIRFALYVILLLVGRILTPVLGLVVFVGLVTFFGAWALAQENQKGMMILGACLATGSVALQLFYDALLRAVAPEGTVIVSEL
jgi:hypothetical protein